jgi:small subunit ribosomal protein S6
MRIYEELFILRPDVTEEQVDAYIEQMKALIIGSKGTVDKVEKWGVRKLAYRVEKRTEGFYILIQFTTADTALAKEIERRMRVTDFVMKWVTVRIDEALKKLEKRKVQRERRARRKPAPVAPILVPAVPVAPAHPAEPVVAPGQPNSATPAPAAAAPVAPAPAPAPAPAEAPAAAAPVEAPVVPAAAPAEAPVTPVAPAPAE